MGTRQKGHILPLARHLAKPFQKFTYERIVDPVRRLANGVWRGGVVDVLRGEAEVHELAVVVQPEFVHLLLYEILHRLDVVVGGAFDLLYSQGVLDLEVLIDRPQVGEVLLFEVGELRQRYSAQGNEVLYLHQHAVADEGVLRKIVVQRQRCVAIPAVYGRNSRDFSQFHDVKIIRVCLKFIR